MIWRCSRCKGILAEIHNGITCNSCGSHYERIGGIPDLRISGAAWIDYEIDKARARRLLAETEGFSLEEIIRFAYKLYSDWDDARVELRTRQVIQQPNRIRNDIRKWLNPLGKKGGVFVDVGCGHGALLASAAAEGFAGIGIDVSIAWLVVAWRMIEAWGGKPILAAALGEALPLADSSVSGVVSLDVIEHVANPGSYLNEIDRVTKRGGYLALSTPNRYSLAAEPHVFAWGVGWLPRAFQKTFVKWRTGKSYELTRLLSTREAAKLLRKHTRFQFQIQIPPVPEEEIAHFAPYRAFLAKVYNLLLRLPYARWLCLCIGPFFRIVGQKI